MQNCSVAQHQIGNDLYMAHSTMMIYRLIWQCDAGHIDITGDTVISLFDPVLDSMPCSFFKRDIQSTALQARGGVDRVRVHSNGCSSLDTVLEYMMQCVLGALCSSRYLRIVLDIKNSIQQKVLKAE